MKSQTTMIFLFLLLTTACGPAPAGPAPDLVSTVVAGTLTAQPSATFTSIPSFTPEPPSTRPPDFVTTTAANVNLRVGPGNLFKVSRVMAQGTRLQLLAFARGGDWAQVLNDEGILGWVGVNFISDWSQFAVIFVEPEDVHVVSGRVLDGQGNPLEGLGYAVFQGNDTLRTDAITDSGGYFYAYLPPHLTGIWTVEFVSIDCSSPLVDSNCACPEATCGEPQPSSRSVTLPWNELLSFTWIE
jgi:hypothetical protein